MQITLNNYQKWHHIKLSLCQKLSQCHYYFHSSFSQSIDLFILLWVFCFFFKWFSNVEREFSRFDIHLNGLLLYSNWPQKVKSIRKMNSSNALFVSQCKSICVTEMNIIIKNLLCCVVYSRISKASNILWTNKHTMTSHVTVF